MAAPMCFTSCANRSQRPVRRVSAQIILFPHLFHMPPPPSRCCISVGFSHMSCVFMPLIRPPRRPQGLFVPRSSATNLPPSSPTIQMGSTHHFKCNNKTHFHFKEKGTDCISRCGRHPSEPAVIFATFPSFSLSLFPLSRRPGKLDHISPISGA